MSLERSHENVIEFLDSENEAMLTLSKQKYITKVKRLKESHPDEVYVVENADGTIFAKVPVKWVKISPPRAISEEQRQASAERLSKLRKSKRMEGDES